MVAEVAAAASCSHAFYFYVSRALDINCLVERSGMLSGRWCWWCG